IKLSDFSFGATTSLFVTSIIVKGIIFCKDNFFSRYSHNIAQKSGGKSRKYYPSHHNEVTIKQGGEGIIPPQTSM
ncbi:MAG: hypothetical protein IJ979_04220, partial [Tidjanibacter sp.]|nr:hypothetical protein [Tidjanibacter sp.]